MYLILNTFYIVYLLIVYIYMYIFFIFLEKHIHTTNMKYFFPVDSAAHFFMFNVTPCSITDKNVWKANLTWIPSESLLTRQIYSANAKKINTSKKLTLHPKHQRI